jgi:hypothetical protein
MNITLKLDIKLFFVEKKKASIILKEEDSQILQKNINVLNVILKVLEERENQEIK